jgi:MoxR-like ATPase
MQIVRNSFSAEGNMEVQAVADAAVLQYAASLTRKIYVDEKIENFILDIIQATRKPSEYKMPSLTPLISYGASPRASIYLTHASKAFALLQKRAYVVPDDVITLAPDILRHRIGLTYEAEAEEINVENIIKQILKNVPAP